MIIDDPTGQPMRWRQRLLLLDFSIIHRFCRKHLVPYPVFRLRRDTEQDFPSEDDEIPILEDATVFTVRKRGRTAYNADEIPLEFSVNKDDPSDDDLDNSLDANNLVLDAIDLYQAVYLEACIDSDHRDVVKDAERNPPIKSEVSTTPSSAPVSDVPMRVTISEIIAAQKTKNFCQTVFITMDQPKSLFFKGEYFVLH